jgi:quercetin dioxygenase-like cupin family protein
MDHPTVIHAVDHAVFAPEKMGKTTLFSSPHLLVGLNAFEPGQAHALHAHAGMDKVYHVLAGEGVFLLDGSELPMRAGDLLVAPDGVPHGVRNTSAARLVVLVVLAPGAHGR